MERIKEISYDNYKFQIIFTNWAGLYVSCYERAVVICVPLKLHRTREPVSIKLKLNSIQITNLTIILCFLIDLSVKLLIRFKFNER